MSRLAEHRAHIDRVFTDLHITPRSVTKGQTLTKSDRPGVPGFTTLPALFRGSRELIVARYRTQSRGPTMMDVVRDGDIVGERVAVAPTHILESVALTAGTIQIATIDQILRHPSGKQLLMEAAVTTADRLLTQAIYREESIPTRTLHALREFANGEGLVMVSLSTVAERVGTTRRTIHAFLSELEDTRLISREGNTSSSAIHVRLGQEQDIS